MIKYFYLVDFSYSTSDGCESCFDLGVYSTKQNACKKIENSMSLKGFNEYSTDNFKIIKFGVDFEREKVDKSDVTLYSVTHEYEVDNVTYWCVFDYMSTIEKARVKVDFLKLHSRVGKKYPDNFEIQAIKVDSFTAWAEGFDSIDE